MSKSKQNEFLKYYEPIKQNLWRYCYFLTENKQIAEDLLGETIAITYKSFDSIQNKTTFLSYLFTIANRTFYKQFYKKQTASINDFDFDMLDLSSQNALPDKITDVKILIEFLNLLPIEQKEAIILKEMEGFTLKEISEIQKVSEETVKSRIYRGKLKLKSQMEVKYE